MAGASVRLGLVGSDEPQQHEPVAAFISKVWKILEKPEYNQLITWSNVRDDFKYNVDNWVILINATP